MPEKIAFFDFDDTLCSGDSILPYLLYAIRRGYAPRRQLLAAAYGYIQWLRNPIFASRAKTWSLSFIKGRTVEEMDALGRDFLRGYVAKRCFPQARKELERLRGEGYRIVVVTASAGVYMRLLPEFLPIDSVIATACMTDGSRRYTGQIGENCKGAEKPRRIKRWLASHGPLTPDWPACRAYGDSLSDAPMLELVGHPVLVDPKKPLRQHLPEAEAVHWHK